MVPVRRILAILIMIGVVLLLIFALAPLFYMFSSAFKPTMEILRLPPRLGFSPTLLQYRDVVSKGFTRYILNSVVVVTGTTLLSLALGIPAAYSLARFKFAGSKNMAIWFLSLLMIPPIVIIIPLYLVINSLRILNTWISLILVYTTFNVPIVVWLMRGFFIDLPWEPEEAAIIDGCSRVGALIRITLPAAKSSVLATAMICFIFSWNEFLYALVLTNTQTAMTATVGVSLFMTDRVILWGQMCAAGTFLIIPILIASIFIQKHLVRGLTFGAVKG